MRTQGNQQPVAPLQVDPVGPASELLPSTPSLWRACMIAPPMWLQVTEACGTYGDQRAVVAADVATGPGRGPTDFEKIQKRSRSSAVSGAFFRSLT